MQCVSVAFVALSLTFSGFNSNPTNAQTVNNNSKSDHDGARQNQDALVRLDKIRELQRLLEAASLKQDPSPTALDRDPKACQVFEGVEFFVNWLSPADPLKSDPPTHPSLYLIAEQVRRQNKGLNSCKSAILGVATVNPQLMLK